MTCSIQKPHIALAVRKSETIPGKWRAYCHACQQGFMSIDELSAHNRKKLAAHQGKSQ